jgi:hypothetical protein
MEPIRSLGRLLVLFLILSIPVGFYMISVAPVLKHNINGQEVRKAPQCRYAASLFANTPPFECR